MSDKKLLLVIVLAFGGLAAIWWFGWFGPAIEVLNIKKYTAHP